MKDLNKCVRTVKTNPQKLYYWPLKGQLRILAQRGQCIFMAEPRTGSHDSRATLIDYVSHKKTPHCSFNDSCGVFYRALWADITAEEAEVHMRTDANNLVTTASTTRLPEQKETMHMVHMLRQEACSGQMQDSAHVRTQYCLADPFTKSTISPDTLIRAITTSVLPRVDCNPLFRSQVGHRAFLSQSDIDASPLDYSRDPDAVLDY
eukprot:1926586-Amphidinium_carterae.2